MVWGNLLLLGTSNDKRFYLSDEVGVRVEQSILVINTSTECIKRNIVQQRRIVVLTGFDSTVSIMSYIP